MSDQYTPTTDVVRDRYGIEAGYARLIHAEDALPEFDRWLAAHDAEVARAAAERALPSAEALEHLFQAEFKASRTIATTMANAVRGLIRSAS